MSNFTYAFLVLAAGGILFLSERRVYVEAHANTRQLQAQIGSHGEQLSRLEQNRSELERRLAEARDQTRTSGQAEAQPRVVVPPNPDRNGGWPTNEPYFYLPKRDLPGVGLVAFMTNAPIVRLQYVSPEWTATNTYSDALLPWTNRLSNDAAILFGMTPTDREAVDEAYHKLWETFHQLCIDRVERIDPEPGWSIPVVSEYHVPPHTNEARAVLSELEPTFRSVLGILRADYFVEGAPGVSIRNALESAARCEYYRVFGPNRSPDGKAQTAISDSSDGTSYWSGDGDYHRWFFKDFSTNSNP